MSSLQGPTSPISHDEDNMLDGADDSVEGATTTPSRVTEEMAKMAVNLPQSKDTKAQIAENQG